MEVKIIRMLMDLELERAKAFQSIEKSATKKKSWCEGKFCSCASHDDHHGTP